METKKPSSFRQFLPSTLVLAIAGWGGLALIIFSYPPTVWPRWFFYLCLTLALTGAAMPVTWFLNLRFPSTPPAGPAVIVRQAIWFGVYGATLAWLENSSLVTLWLAFGLGLGLVAIEYLIRMRERARWQPAPFAEPPLPEEVEPDEAGDSPDPDEPPKS